MIRRVHSECIVLCTHSLYGVKSAQWNVQTVHCAVCKLLPTISVPILSPCCGSFVLYLQTHIGYVHPTVDHRCQIEQQSERLLGWRWE